MSSRVFIKKNCPATTFPVLGFSYRPVDIIHSVLKRNMVSSQADASIKIYRLNHRKLASLLWYSIPVLGYWLKLDIITRHTAYASLERVFSCPRIKPKQERFKIWFSVFWCRSSDGLKSCDEKANEIRMKESLIKQINNVSQCSV